ncbi:MAG: hypothetical protein HOG03_11520 [Desulfobacula sp.]|jgi:hypothetical protein|uniref:hypothetical protein n=1 Tax=Desulfobacula sp. TaxID=2593537 RepID=UPI001E188D49|nr:hypothetical protein [Desulfobacula sp.]MBT3484080.1 hypothetical protein [Desulfobacula sp.]MBT3805212.1 hypothetical protein [Desulfobacula sp.]MBT4024545.1 hypothetical protein [Desulfobacula sp.]MBT4199861.1 hypothetical protein [Desulfobacula sp.]
MAEVIRRIAYRTIDDEPEPVLLICPKFPREGHTANFCIRMEDLWMYTPDKNPDFTKWMYNITSLIYYQFNLGVVTSQRMAEVATAIEDGIEELLSATPEPLLPPATTPGGRSGDGIKINGNKVII